MLLAVFAMLSHQPGQAGHSTTVVGTVMSNIGLLKFGEMSDVHIETTKVGDRYVLERDAGNRATTWAASSRATSSFCDYMTTGDGQLSARPAAAASWQRPAGNRCRNWRRVMKKYPQVLVNVTGATSRSRTSCTEKSPVAAADRRVRSSSWAGDGRMLVRPLRDRAADPGHGGRRRIGSEITGLWRQRIAETIKERLGK